jgi:hypothetical protein
VVYQLGIDKPVAGTSKDCSLTPEEENQSAMTRPDQASAGKRVPGLWRGYPGWENYIYDPAVLAPMTDQEMAAEGWS